MFDLTIPPLRRALRVMDFYMATADRYALNRGIDPALLIQARLAPDMLNLAGQVQRISDNARYGAARLLGGHAPSMEDSEETFVELKQRLAKTDIYLADIDRADFEASADRAVTLSFRSVFRSMNGFEYLSEILMPNVYFHQATTHAILRGQGLPVGKRDYLGETLREAAIT
ncbi:DUF1993 domain-containing protein [Variovorax paradoxus]|nr:DUF1993 domain-containing protein [Variovorax paradoxus]MBT2300007.1 DUF1993 domain-containing protein [Variovorax paradoxus]